MSKLPTTISLPLLIFIGSISLFSQEPKLEWLPSGSYFEVLLFDPTSAQTSASLLVYELAGSSEEKVYSPINIGVRKMIGRYELNNNRGFELGLEFGMHSQFTIVDVGEAYMGGLQNTDYRIAAIFHYKKDSSTYRISLFHQSSHLGDDYMLRTEYFQPNSNSVLNPLSFSFFSLATNSGSSIFIHSPLFRHILFDSLSCPFFP